MVTVYLVRHGEVDNPNHVVYGDLPGFNLSPRGVLQAHATATHLARAPLDVVACSPLARAAQTATAIARTRGFTPRIEEDLTEARLFPNWTGHRWEDLPTRFPGQLERYLADASDLADATEPLEAVAERAVGVIDTIAREGFHHVAIVSHQDLVQAARLTLLGVDLGDLLVDPPPHGSVTTLESDGATWREISRWDPAVGDPAVAGPQLDQR